MQYRGRIITAAVVLIINCLYLAYYFAVNGRVDIIEKIGVPVMVAIAWWFGKQYDRAKFFSEKDAVTEIYNRRFVYRAFSALARKSSKQRGKIHVLLIDINHFKQINDTYGHNKGDAVLKAVASAFLAQKNKSDVIARWGGDEFVILSPDGNNRDSAAIMKEIKAAIVKEWAKMEEFPFHISMSAGTAVYPDEAATLEELIGIADKRMYQMKQESKSEYTGLAAGSGELY